MSPTRWQKWALAACCLAGAIVLWVLLRAPQVEPVAAEGVERKVVVATAPEPSSPLPEAQSAPSVDLRMEEARVELSRSPEATGPRKSHAKVELVCGCSGAVVNADEVRIQVLADSDASEIDERASRATFTKRNAQRVHVADVTELLFGVQPLPKRLRVVAETPRCRTVRDVELALSPEELASPSLITLAVSLYFDCPWFARGRIVATCPPGEVRVFEGTSGGSRVHNLLPALGWRVDEQGVFELPLSSPGPKHLTFRAEGALSAVREFVVDGRGDVELGDIVLESGATLSGQLFAGGEPLVYAEVALVRADARIAADAPLEGSDAAWAGSVLSRPVLRRMLAELGLFADNDGSTEPIVMARTNLEGRFEASSLRPGRHWLVVLSAGGQPTWLAPTSFEAPTLGFTHDFDAARVRFEFARTQPGPPRTRVVRTLYVRMPDSELVPFESAPFRSADLHALVRPGTLLELHACNQEVLVPVVPSAEPLVTRVTPCD